MKSSVRNLSFLTVACAMLALATPAQASMTGAQIKSALRGKSFVYSGPATGTIQYRSNGTQVVTYTSHGKSGRKTGTWYARGSKLCSKMVRKDSHGKKTVKCDTLTDIGGGKYKTGNGYTLTPR